MAKKRKTKKKEKYDLGGLLKKLQPLLPALNLAVPGLGSGLSMAAGVGSTLLEEEPGSPLNQTTNIYMKGGLLKKYNAPSHAKGGQLINKLGNPDPNGKAEIELQEAAVTDPKGDSYIFSDRLGTADKIKKIYSRMKGNDSISRKGRELSTKNIIKENEILKEQQEMKYGGKYQNGGILPDLSLDYLNPSSYSGMLPVPLLPQSTPTPSLGKTPITETPTYDNQLSMSNEKKSQLPLDKLGLGLKGLGYLGSAIDAFQKPAKETPRLTDYNRGNRLVAGTGISDDALQSEIDLQTSKSLDINRSVSGNVGNYLSGAQNILSVAGRNKALTASQTKQYNDQLKLQKAARADIIARDDATKLREVDVANLQNKARSQDLVSKFMGDINNLGSELMRQGAIKSQLANMNEQQKKDFLLKAAALNIQNPNFQIGSLNEIQQALDTGDYESVIKAIVSFKK
jgi:hypothetical protein